eukprot:CAMPEP_0119307324 /NCGR_PEP_ID=MMETSP1333-20130426/7863_1 /TAXON_ID=418940 /ORGANISM="Scyphosphaera apsteinii, Strain RCC1455" /LENGTH=402 /DNA_ID=CAMNT_0007310853 /DNA_START=18 /DNA_END=1226 /DNA_ORIENTATION=+
MRVLSWPELKAYAKPAVVDLANGPVSSKSRLRLFASKPEDVEVVLYRDHHAWCPYCQKVWLWLEEKKIPYRVEKVTMFCYGEKESWYKRLVPSGMLPALSINGQVVTESDRILAVLEQHFGPLGYSLADCMPQRRLERQLFGAWCEWLCYPAQSAVAERGSRTSFERVAAILEQELGKHEGPFLKPSFSAADVILTPYIERMSASLYYYKGFTLRCATERPNIKQWFEAMETRESYRGMQGDFHTHCHDLPPQMGGCHESRDKQQQHNAKLVDAGNWALLPETSVLESAASRSEAIANVIAHKDNIIKVNPCTDAKRVDEALRCVLTRLATGEEAQPPHGVDVALRYIRDRINVPRDMSLWAARRLRDALEETAALSGHSQGPPIPTAHRRDQDPCNFVSVR